MKYKVQSKWGHEEDFHTISNERAGHQEFDNLETAIRVFETNVNMARMAYKYQRIIDSDGNVLKYYDFEIWAKGLGDGIS